MMYGVPDGAECLNGLPFVRKIGYGHYRIKDEDAYIRVKGYFTSKLILEFIIVDSSSRVVSFETFFNHLSKESKEDFIFNLNLFV